MIRSPWDYVARRDDFVAWAHRVPRLLNPADVVEWNTDKRYLAELAAAGMPVIPTDFVAPGESGPPPAAGEWVVKPDDQRRQPGHRPLPAARPGAARRGARGRLTAAGRTAMIQPYLAAVDTAGETAVLCLPDRAAS